MAFTTRISSSSNCYRSTTLNTNFSDEPNFATTRDACAAAKKEPMGKFNIVLYFGQTEQLVNLDYGTGKGK